MTAADLTTSERLVIDLLMVGRTPKQIAAQIGRSMQVVSTRLARLRDRVGVRTNFQLGAWCERHGIREAQN